MVSHHLQLYTIERINTTLSIISERKVDGGHSIKYKNKYFKTLLTSGQTVCFKKGSTALVIEAFDGHLYANVLDELHVLEEIPEHSEYSADFEIAKKEVKERKLYIPPMSHPWKRASYINYIMKMKHRNNSANV